MPTAIYKINRRFDYCDADRLQAYLSKQGVVASVESSYPLDEIHITSNATHDVLNQAVELATMNYCSECTQRLRALDDHML